MRCYIRANVSPVQRVPQCPSTPTYTKPAWPKPFFPSLRKSNYSIALMPCESLSIPSHFSRLRWTQKVDLSFTPLTRKKNTATSLRSITSNTEVPLPLRRLLRRQSIRARTQENRHIAQIHTKALRQPLALATRSRLVVKPRTRGPTETALAIPLPRETAGKAVAEVARVAADRTRAAGRGI
jgi:hypothetical protein